VKLASLVTIAILITGIFMVHLKDGWYVVGAGRNGIEFNFLMIIVLLTIMFSRGVNNQSCITL
jgi:putative oxidoreductase